MTGRLRKIVSVLVIFLGILATVTLILIMHPYLQHPELARLEKQYNEISSLVSKACRWCSEHRFLCVKLHNVSECVPLCVSGASCAGCCYIYTRVVLNSNYSWEDCYSLCTEAEYLAEKIYEMKNDTIIYALSGVLAGGSIAAMVFITVMAFMEILEKKEKEGATR